MKLKKEEIRKIAELVFKNLQTKALVSTKAPSEKVILGIETAIFKNMSDESAIEEEVKKLMDQYRTQIASGAIDPQKVYTMIKKQVAKDRKFVL